MQVSQRHTTFPIDPTPVISRSLSHALVQKEISGLLSELYESREKETLVHNLRVEADSELQR